MTQQERTFIEISYREFPVKKVMEGNAFDTYLVDINDANRRIYLKGLNDGADWATNKEPDTISIKIQGVPKERQEDVRKSLQRFIETIINATKQ